MTITFDKGLATERSLSLDRYNENILTNRFTGSSEFNSSNYPDLSGFVNNTDFTTMEITEGETELEYSGTYNKVDNLSVNYDRYVKLYTLNISLTYKTA